MGIFRQHHQNPTTAAVLPQYTGLQLQTSAAALPVPICYGMVKLPPNVVYYGNFYTNNIYYPGTFNIIGYWYQCDLIFSLCEGPITGINRVFIGKNVYSYDTSSPSYPWNTSVYANHNYDGLHLGTIGQTTDATWASVYPAAQQVPYSGNAYTAVRYYNLDGSAALGDINFEVQGRLYGTGPNGYDADPALVIQDFLTNTQYGVGFPAASLDTTTLLGGDGTSSMQAYCKAMNFQFSPLLNQPESAVTILSRWLQICNTAAFRSGGLLKFVPYGDINANGNSTSWIAPIDPIYDIDDTQLVHHQGEDPIKVSRVDPYTLPSIQRIEIMARGIVTGGTTTSQYQIIPIEARDLSSLQQTGGRAAPQQTLHEIMEPSVGASVVQTMLQRGLYVRAYYKFTLSWLYCLLDPMDIITLTDPNIGLLRQHVRIIEIVENDQGLLEFTAERVDIGVSTPGNNPTTDPGGTNINTAVQVSPVNAIIIYQPPSGYSTTQYWFGASGGLFDQLDPFWGGCKVWASIDAGVSYTQVATINSRLRYGTLTAAYASATGFDITNTLSVFDEQGIGTYTSQSDVNAQNNVANTLLVDSEIMSFATQSLTSADHYNFTRIQRASYSSSAAAHAIGALFSDTDDMVVIATPAWFTGTILFKFQSFNIYGSGLQGLSSCRAFTYVPTSKGYQMRTTSEIVSLASGATVLSTITIPAGAYLIGVWIKNLSNISGPNNILLDPELTSAGGAGPQTGTFGIQTTDVDDDLHYQQAQTIWTAASKIRLTGDSANFSGGLVQISIEWIRT